MRIAFGNLGQDQDPHAERKNLKHYEYPPDDIRDESEISRRPSDVLSKHITSGCSFAWVGVHIHGMALSGGSVRFDRIVAAVCGRCHVRGRMVPGGGLGEVAQGCDVRRRGMDHLGDDARPILPSRIGQPSPTSAAPSAPDGTTSRDLILSLARG